MCSLDPLLRPYKTILRINLKNQYSIAGVGTILSEKRTELPEKDQKMRDATSMQWNKEHF